MWAVLRYVDVHAGAHFARVRHYTFNVERLYQGKTAAKITDILILDGLSGDYIGALTFNDVISYDKKGELTDLVYLGQDTVPSVSEVTVLQLRVFPNERMSFSFPVNDRSKCEGMYFQNEQRQGSFYFYKN